MLHPAFPAFPYIGLGAFLVAVAAGAPAPALPTSLANPGPTLASSSSLPLASVASIESSVRSQLAQASVSAGILIPSGIPHYAELVSLANVWPPVQTLQGQPSTYSAWPFGDAASYNEGLIAVSNSSSTDAGNITKRDGTRRILIVGDSMTHGQEGDFTWRYRIWHWFQDNGISVQMVGPYTGTFVGIQYTGQAPQPPPIQPPQPTSTLSVNGRYAQAAGDFDSHHFAVWGRTALLDSGLIQDVVTNHPADIMLLMLGFNDITWLSADAHGLLNNIHQLIINARKAQPNMAFAIANVPHRPGFQSIYDRTENYNQLLPQALVKWNTTQSPLYLVHLEENYDCGASGCPAGYDGLHPNEYGEYLIAHAFSLTLYNNMGIGNGPLAIPDRSSIPPRDLGAITGYTAGSSPQGVTATWNYVYGAYGYEVNQTLNGGTYLDFSATSVNSPRWDTHWPAEGFEYTVAIRAVAGQDRAGPWSPTVTVTAHPQLAPGPTNVNLIPTQDGFDISWDPPTGPYTGDSIVEYNVIYWDTDSCDYLGGMAVANSPASITARPGHHIFVAVTTWNINGESLPEILSDVMPGTSSIPGTPTGLSVISADEFDAHVTWNDVPYAAGYDVYLRDTRNGANNTLFLDGDTKVSCYNRGFIFAFVEWYEFCVQAYNGNLKSSIGESQCVSATKPTSNVPVATCPVYPGWCPGGPPANTYTFTPETGIPGPDTTPTSSAAVSTSSVTSNPNGLNSGVVGITTIFSTVGIDEFTTTITEILVPTTITSNGQIVTEIIVENPTATTSPPQGAVVTTVTALGTDSTITILVETLVIITVSNNQDSTRVITSTGGAVYPFDIPSGGTITMISTVDAAGSAIIIPEALIPTIGVDGSGNTITGIYTYGMPSPTVGNLATYSTITGFPSGTTIYSTSVASNTHDPNTSNCPVFGPWPQCWFCLPGSHGLKICGLHPGLIIIPPTDVPVPPGFGEDLPVITIGPNADPIFPSKPGLSNTPSATASQESCTSTQTVTDVTYFVSYGVNPSGSTTSTSTFSTRSTIVTACTVTATTVTVSATTCSEYSVETGLCDNGNFPLWNPDSNSISCDLSTDMASVYTAGCQQDADDFYDYSLALIECSQQQCSTASKRDLFGLDSMLTSNGTSKSSTHTHESRQAQKCPPTQPPGLPGYVYPGGPGCVATFQCNTDKWPNVCNNALSAISRGKPSILTYQGPGARDRYVTTQWRRTHAQIGSTLENPSDKLQRDAGTFPKQPGHGWGLIGCEVEEYPFGNSLQSPVPRGPWAARSVLRLIPWEENREHGNAIDQFIDGVIAGANGVQPQSRNGGWPYCVSITGSRVDTQEFLLTAGSPYNRCGRAHGVGFLLVNNIIGPELRAFPGDRLWDQWFDDKDQLFVHTTYSKNGVVKTTMMPKQYGKYPSPGMMTYISALDKWTTSVAGAPKAVGTPRPFVNPGRTGQNLVYNDAGDAPSSLFRRGTDDNGDDNTAKSIGFQTFNNSSGKYLRHDHLSAEFTWPSSRETRRQAAGQGSFLDASVYTGPLACSIPYQDPCDTTDCFEGTVVYDINGNVAVQGNNDQSGPDGIDVDADGVTDTPEDFITTTSGATFSGTASMTTTTTAPGSTASPATRTCHIHAIETIDRAEDANGNTFHLWVSGELDIGDSSSPIASVGTHTSLPITFDSNGAISTAVTATLLPSPGSQYNFGFVFGSQTWDTTGTTDSSNAQLPYCNVGNYASDKSDASGSSRQMDCYFLC